MLKWLKEKLGFGDNEEELKRQQEIEEQERLKEEELKKAEELKQQEELEKQEELKKQKEFEEKERQKQEEIKRQEELKKAEDLKKEEEAKKQKAVEEERRQSEEKNKREEAKKVEDLKKQEEAKKLQEDKEKELAKQEEVKKQEDLKKAEELKKQAELEKQKELEEKERQKQEEIKKQEELAKAEELKRQEEEARQKEAEEKERLRREELAREEEIKRQRELEEELKRQEELKAEEKPKKKNFFEKLKDGLTKTRDDMTEKIDSILKSYQKVDEELFEDLEEVMIMADVGMETTMRLIDNLRDRVKADKVTEPEGVKSLLKDEIRKLMVESVESNELVLKPYPSVILVVGVNGVGKTTTIGKLSNRFKEEGHNVLMAAGDTFRAAAIEQLGEWSNRSGVDMISQTEGSDPAAVIFDGIQAAKARNTDILICDTAGRLHNKSNLMNELNKIFRVVDREYGDATKEVLLVLDATTGQNAINQAKVFKEVANITGVVLTKLDGTAKGGVIIALQSELGLPVKLVGVGEGIDDLQPFNTEDFVEALFD